MILLDTHVVHWMDSFPDRLGTHARAMILAEQEAGTVAVSAISFLEFGTLRRKGRLTASLPVERWRDELLALGVLEIPVDGAIALLAAGLEQFHPDPADRMIVATALAEEATLLTADDLILRWRGVLRRHDARS